ncbi:interferon gamma receptor 2 [Embiotoca jacksoni]|uniref:interferon gamma receptor 2 n=1 Tax=Embiotoca jacksoni TaxID=100190 RepID=UPI0037041355
MRPQTRRPLGNEAATMFVRLACFLIVVRALPEPPPPPLPLDVHVEKGQLRWTPATDEPDVTFKVQYRSSNVKKWSDVPGCGRTSNTSCDFADAAATAEHGCVMLRVRAVRRGVASEEVAACSRHGDSCSPEFSLKAWPPGSLTVLLTRNHSLHRDYADHTQHRVYYGKEGEKPQLYGDYISQAIINDLEVGQRYCVEVEFVTHRQPVGLSSCAQCEVVLKPGDTSHAGTITVVVFAVVVLFVGVPTIAYFIIFHHGKLKQCLRPPYQITDLMERPPERAVQLLDSPTENYDVITSIEPKD